MARFTWRVLPVVAASVVLALTTLQPATATPTTTPAAPPESSSHGEDGRTCAPTRPPGSGWRLAWHDEFTGRTLDRTKWNTVMDFPGRAGGHYHNDNYGSYALDENIVLRHGRLHLITDDEPVVGDDPPGLYDYSEGFISSHDTFFQAYGYWQICARYPAGRGLWPAFWLVPQDRSWPPEFDVAEWFGGIDGMHQGIASGTWPNVHWDSHWIYDPAPTTGWHTYALLWEPGRAVFYVDGRPTATFEGTFVPDKPMYVVLNSGVWVNDHRGGPPDDTTVFPNAFEVDHVRVYSRHGSPAPR